MVSNSHLDAEVWEAASDVDIEPENVEDAYQGEYDSDQNFAYQLADDLGEIDENASWLKNCIDWERAARDLMFDYVESNNHYFKSM
jgi:antirestriction protein